MPGGADWGHVVKSASTMKLAKLFAKGIKKFDYLYDMGDSWAHQISLERFEAAQPGRLYPELLEGQRRCPPEDCGGVPGYDEFLNVITAPDHGKEGQRKKEALQWYGEPYDPENIEEDKIRKNLRKIAK